MIYSYNAPAKINIGLDVLRRREDGYHDLRMIMQTVTLFDTLTFNVNDGSSLSMTCTDDSLPVDEGNLVMKAANMLIEEFKIKSDIRINLEKRIPVAAGMAGGSSDAAMTFIALNDIFALNLSKEELMKRAVKLGADIPYCIMQGTALSEGIGDILTPLNPLNDISILIAKPPVSVSTGFVYGNLEITGDTVHPDIDGIIDAIGTNDLKKAAGLLGNVLETVTIPAYPVIRTLKSIMLSNGALGSLMSGSGPTVFGIFEDDHTAQNAMEQCRLAVDGLFTATAGCYNP